MYYVAVVFCVLHFISDFCTSLISHLVSVGGYIHNPESPSLISMLTLQLWPT